MPWCSPTMPRACSHPRFARLLFRPPASWVFRCWSTPNARILLTIAAPPPSVRISVSCL
jgi:hypothetical protein